MSKLRPFRCKLCSSSYKRRYHLTRHQKSEHGSEREVCVLCGKTTSRRDKMIQHLRLKHNYDPKKMGAPTPSGSKSPFLSSKMHPVWQHFFDSVTPVPVNDGGANPVVDNTEDPFEEITNEISPEAVPVGVPVGSAVCASDTDPAPVLTPLQPVVIDCKDTSEEYILGYGGDDVVTVDEGERGNGVRMETDSDNNEHKPILRSIIEDYRNIDNDDLFQTELSIKKEMMFDDKRMISLLMSELPEENEDVKPNILIKKEIDNTSNDNILFNLVPQISSDKNVQNVQKTATQQVKKENEMNACNSLGNSEIIQIDDDSTDSGGNDAEEMETESLEPVVSSSGITSVAVQTDNVVDILSTEKPIDCEVVVTCDKTKQMPVPEQSSNYSFCRMITRAILSSPDRRISLKELLLFIPKHYPYFSTRPDGWQASIQDYLCRSKHFVRNSERDFKTWILNPATESKTIARYMRGPSEKKQMDSVCPLSQFFPCPDCGLKYKHKDELTRHQSVAHNASRLECNVCGVKCSQSESLKHHIELVHGSGVIPPSQMAQAPVFQVADPSAADRPATVPYAAASPTGISSVAVPYAAASPTGISSVAVPYAAAPPTGIPSVAAHPTAVPYAPASPTGIPSLAAQPAEIPSVIDRPASVPYTAVSPTGIPSAAARPAASPPARFPCSVCGLNFKCKYNLKRHQTTTHSTVIPSVSAPLACFPCPDCGLKFKRKDNLKRHQSGHHSGADSASSLLVCNVCGDKYSQSESLKHHIELVHGSGVIPSSQTAQAPEFPVAAPLAGIPSAADRPATVPYAAVSPTRIPSVAVHPAASPPSGIPSVAASPTGIPSVAAHPAAAPPSGIPSVAASPIGIPSVAAHHTAVPYTAASPTGIPSVAAHHTAVPYAAASPTGIPSVASHPAAAPPAVIPSVAAYPTEIPSVIDRPASVPYTVASFTGIQSVAAHPAAVPNAAAPPAGSPSVKGRPASVLYTGASLTGIPSAAPRPSASLPARFPCLVCGLKFKRKSTLKRHQTTIHSRVIPSVADRPAAVPPAGSPLVSAPLACFPCPDCGLKYKRKDHLQRHQSRHHRGAHSVTSSLLEECNVCGDKYSRSDTLKRHIELFHGSGVIPSSQTAQAPEFPLAAPSAADRPATVPYAAASPTGIPSAEVPPAGSPSVSAPLGCFPCPDCGLEYKRKDHLKRHQSRYHRGAHSVTSSLLECKVCGAKYSRSETLKRHIELFHESEPIPSLPTAQAPEFPAAAPPAGIPSVAAQPAGVHHVAARPVAASSTEDPDYLPGMDLDSLHEPRFECPDCELTYKHKRHLHRHQAITHSKATPFECHVCGVKMHRNDHLKLHIRRIHGPGAIASSPTFSSAGPPTVKIET